MTPKPPVASCPICLDLLTSAVGDSQSTGGGHGAQGCHGLHGCRPGAGLVALLPSCGHKYHQACITTWAERTNSCPSCRTKFNCVELIDDNGQFCRSIDFEDRSAPKDDGNIDPGDYYDDEDQYLDGDGDFVYENCVVCSSGERAQELLVCDGCERSFHITCLGLALVPFSDWYCPTCEIEIGDAYCETTGYGPLIDAVSQQPSRRPRRRRTRAARSTWTRSTRSTGRSTASSASRSTRTTRSAMSAISALANPSANTPTISISYPAASSPSHEQDHDNRPAMSSEERQAWDMLEQAQQLDQDDGPSNFGVESSNSNIDHADPSGSLTKLKRPSRRRNAPTPAVSKGVCDPPSTTLIGSLLHDIRAAPSITPLDTPLVSTSSSPSGQPQSPGSPQSSEPSSPNSPVNGTPMKLSPDPTQARGRHAVHKLRELRERRNGVQLSLEGKERVQRLVRDALRPEYRAGRIDKDQYTRINQKVSRTLYQLVSKGNDGEDVSGIQHLVTDHVRTELNSLHGLMRHD
uniref:ARAD1D36498p n=1 Tax=Blastobotrys adeninivorans TaxID=409370 RepID=A0A060TBN5_BLAAD